MFCGRLQSSTLCLNGPLWCVDFVDVITGDIRIGVCHLYE